MSDTDMIVIAVDLSVSLSFSSGFRDLSMNNISEIQPNTFHNLHFLSEL